MVVQQHREQDVLLHGQFRDEVECLKDKTDITAAEDRQFPVFHGKNILAVNQHLAGSRRIQSADQIEQGAFTGAGFANDRHIFAFRHGKADIFQRMDSSFSAAVGLAEMVDF